MNKNVTTYTLGFDKHDPEAIRAREIAKKIGVKNKQIYFKDKEERKNILDEIRKTIQAFGEPINLYQVIYSNLILREMKKDGIKVAVGGNGADEIYYGYDGVNTLKILNIVKKIWKSLKLEKIIPSINHFFKILNEPNEKVKIQLYEKALQEKQFLKNKYKKFLYKKQFEEYAKEIPSKQTIDIFNWLGLRIENEHSITNVADIAGSINSMEIRTIFLNNISLQLAANLPLKWKVKSFFLKKHNKNVLKKILAKRIGEKLTYDKKRGFGYGIKFDQIIHENKKEIERLLFQTGNKIPIYKQNEIKKIYKESKTQKKYDTLIEIIIMCIWFEENIQ